MNNNIHVIHRISMHKIDRRGGGGWSKNLFLGNYQVWSLKLCILPWMKLCNGLFNEYMETENTHSVQSSLDSRPVYVDNPLLFILRRYLLDQRILNFKNNFIDFKWRTYHDHPSVTEDHCSLGHPSLPMSIYYKSVLLVHRRNTLDIQNRHFSENYELKKCRIF